MKLIKSTILLLLFLVSYNLSAETLLNKASVSKLIENVQAAAGVRDVDEMTSYFTDDITITIEMPANMGGTQKVNKEQYKKNVKDSITAYKNYTFVVKDIDIKISEDNKSATVTDLVFETIEVDGRTISMKSHEIITIVISNGVLKVNSVYGQVKPENIKVTTYM
jgi:ketosteroid isomerase-like protein